MSANAVYPNAIFMHTAVTPLVLITAFVLKGSMEMASHVSMLMSAKVICTIAVFMHTVIT